MSKEEEVKDFSSLGETPTPTTIEGKDTVFVEIRLKVSSQKLLRSLVNMASDIVETYNTGTLEEFKITKCRE